MAADDFLDALVHYRTHYPDLESLGYGVPPHLWKAELDRVAPEAMDAITGTSVAIEGGNVSGVLNFRQIHKVRALHARRAELDVTYINPYTQPISAALAGRRMGFLVRL